MYNKLKNKKGFSLIELIVVIAIIGILVMLAAPKFMGYTERARVKRIQNDIKVVEGKIMEEYIASDYQFDGSIPHTELDTMIGDKTLYGVEGKIDKGNIEEGSYKEVDTNLIKEARTKLKGTFYANSDGKVYYVDDKASGSENKDNNNSSLSCGIMQPIPLNLDMTVTVSKSMDITSYGQYWKVSEPIDVSLGHFIENMTKEDTMDVSFQAYKKGKEKYILMKVINSELSDFKGEEIFISKPKDLIYVYAKLNPVEGDSIVNVNDFYYRVRGKGIGKDWIISKDGGNDELLPTCIFDEGPTLIKERLGFLIEISENEKASEYSQDKWNNLQIALNEAKSIKTNKKATLQEVNKIIDTLTQAIVNLERPQYEWVEDSYHEDSYYVDNENGKGYYHYIGIKDEVTIPDKINGNSITSYYGMFEHTKVKKVMSKNKNITTTNSMFAGVESDSLDLSELDTDNVIDMGSMFSGSRIKNLDLRTLNTQNVTNMRGMFYALKSDALTFGNKFNTRRVTNMKNMFTRADVATLDLSSFDTSNVLTMKEMFEFNKSKSIKFGKSFKANKVEDMSGMFIGSIVDEIDLSSFEPHNVTNMEYMFLESKAKKIKLEDSFDTSKVTDMGGMFSLTNATEINLNGFKTSKVTDMSSMFSDSKFKNLDLTKFDTSNVTRMSYMFLNTQVEELDLSSFDISNVKVKKYTNLTMDSMFGNSNVKKVIVRTQSDKEKFESGKNNPEELIYIIK